MKQGAFFRVVEVVPAAGVVITGVISPKADDEVLGVPLAVDSAYLIDDPFVFSFWCHLYFRKLFLKIETRYVLVFGLRIYDSSSATYSLTV